MEKVVTESNSGERGELQVEREKQSVKKEAEANKGEVGKRGRKTIAASWTRIRSSSTSDIRRSLSQKRQLNSPEEQNKIVKKTAMGDKKNEIANTEKMREKFKEVADRDLMLMILGKMERREEEREREKGELKKEIKEELKVELREEEETKWIERSKQLEEKIDSKMEEWERKRKEAEEKQVPAAAEQEVENGVEGKVVEQIKIMEKRCERLEAEERKKCIIIRGLMKERKGLEKEIEAYVKTKMDVEVKVQQANIVGGQENKLIWAKLGTIEEKEKIMEKKKILGNEPVYFESDRSKEEREIQREIVRYAKQLREQKKVVKIRFKRIEVDGIWYRWNEREKALKKEKVFQSGTGTGIRMMD